MYIDDILVILDTLSNHPKDIKETMQNIERYDIKLNRAKCILGSQERKFLGFNMGKNRIHCNLEKIVVIFNMTLLRPSKKLKG